ncbi:MAG TPA: DinB family protein [Candidatus Kapabacteria bacterium]|nr:DinB family protein [Candidatus Kapabacteria bacterium]
MTSKEIFTKRIAQDGPAFASVVKALPADKLDYRPHPNSRSARDLSVSVGLRVARMAKLLEAGKLEMPNMNNLPSLDEIIKEAEPATGKLLEQLKNIDEKTWDEKLVPFPPLGEGMMMPLGEVMWMIYFDGVHHRGQLSTYIRPMGGKVPSIYGPSGDEPARRS